MRYVVLVVVIAALAYVYFANRWVVDQILSGVNSLAPFDADSLAGRKLEPFALPKGHCKASFPGTPHTPHYGQQIFTSLLYPGTTYVLADKDLTYYLDEFAMPAATIGITDVKPIGISLSPVDRATVVNNDAAQGNSYQSDAINAQKSVERCCQDWSKSNNATVETKLPVSVGGGRFNGQEISGHLNDPAKRFRLRIFGDYPHQRMTVIAVIGKAERVRDSTSSRIIDSLEMWP